MSEPNQSVTLRVRGERHERRAPERARARLQVEITTPGQVPAVPQVSEAVAQIRTRLGEGGPRPDGVDSHQVGQLRTWSTVTERGEAQSVAQVEMSVDFTDFVVMADLLTELTARGDVQLGWIEWRLADATLREVERTARHAALEAAMLRAGDYAEALGLGSVQVRAVSDAGLGATASPRMASMMLSQDSFDGRPVLFAPDDVEVFAEVEVEVAAH